MLAVRGAVVDILFSSEELPPIEEALAIRIENGAVVLAEVQAHLDPRTVRAIALEPTAGLRRGDRVDTTGAPLTTPVGEAVLGRLLTVSGKIGDGGAALRADTPRWPIHRTPPALVAAPPETRLFRTGIKVIDLLTPLAQGGKAACRPRRCAGRDDLDLPDAPRSPAGPSGRLPDLRHGAGARDGVARPRAKSRTR